MTNIKNSNEITLILLKHLRIKIRKVSVTTLHGCCQLTSYSRDKKKKSCLTNSDAVYCDVRNNGDTLLCMHVVV